jgi:cyclopropane-fatty-acyl-phospholipid synthase
MRDQLLAPDSPRWPDGVHAAESPASSTSFDRWLVALIQHPLVGVGVRLQLWDGYHASDEEAPAGTIVVHDRRTLIEIAINPDLHFGDAYMLRRLDVHGDLERTLQAFSRTTPTVLTRWRDRLTRLFAPANDRLTARRNVHHHYDIGNDFYRLWLDDQLVYTCAYFPAPDASLEDAQIAKLDLVCRKLRLQPGERVIEAGCGWGALALHMARRYGVTVRAFNISREQLAVARERAAREGLSGRGEFIEDDYRNNAGSCDAFVSVGMLEHVGRRNYAALASAIRRVLDPDTGRGLLHFIGRDRPRPLNAWIRRRIFPGAYPPALGEVHRMILEPGGFAVLDVENLRLHYARTLEHWRERFERAERTVCTMFDDAFYRAWRLYLAGSEAAFVTGTLQLFQVVFAAPRWDPPDWTRASLYTSSDRAGT